MFSSIVKNPGVCVFMSVNLCVLVHCICALVCECVRLYVHPCNSINRYSDDDEDYDKEDKTDENDDNDDVETLR